VTTGEVRSGCALLARHTFFIPEKYFLEVIYDFSHFWHFGIDLLWRFHRVYFHFYLQSTKFPLNPSLYRCCIKQSSLFFPLLQLIPYERKYGNKHQKYFQVTKIIKCMPSRA
jgi:hypothetical protein